MKNYYDDKRLSASKLKGYLVNDPAIAMWNETHPTPPTDAMRMGTALHARMEGKPLIVSPFENYRTKEAQQWRDANPDALKAEEAQEVENWKNAIVDTLSSRYPALYDAYKLGDKELEFYTDTHKAKVDCIHAGIVLDWKSTADKNADKVIREAWHENWAVQAALYLELSGATEFHFVVVSKTAPNPVWVLTCSPAFIEYGRTLIAKAEQIRADFLAGCRADATLNPPPWVKGESDFCEEDMSL